MPKPASTDRPSPAAARTTPLPGVPGHDLLRSALVHARRGDRDALTYLYVRYGDEVAGEIQRLVGDASAAEAIADRVFAELHTTLPADLCTEAKLEVWILGLAREAGRCAAAEAS